ncbi:glucose-6-phosphate isomerase [Candidatus Pelagibacter sp.]|jgi:glucose-6-phosphate isomerase|nr:glucose-6-phosphate isomerase [Candidatus Pelagibacter sp.]
MFSKNINFKNFSHKFNNKKIKKDLKNILSEDNEILKSLKSTYKYQYNKNLIKKINKEKILKIIGIGGSILGTQAIHDYLKYKIKRKIFFYDNLESKLKLKKNSVNIIVSKSGNTLETIANTNILIKKNEKNIFITGPQNSYLRSLALQIKAEIVNHNNFIGGRYAVMSEVGMLPAELMGLNERKFKQLNNLIKNKYFINLLVTNVANTLFFIKNKRFNSIILNYDNSSNNLFKWYQQLIAESLGKKGKGILPIISSMPKDNHSLMQLYLDGPKKNFFTFFYAKENSTSRINNNKILKSHNYLKYKTLENIKFAQKLATQNVFLKKNIPFRSFEVIHKNEQSLGELFCFFILETMLLSKALNVNPYDQPSVELIKKETKKILV